MFYSNAFPQSTSVSYLLNAHTMLFGGLMISDNRDLLDCCLLSFRQLTLIAKLYTVLNYLYLRLP